MKLTESRIQRGNVFFERSDSILTLRLAGQWHLNRNLPSAAQIIPEFSKSPSPTRVDFDVSGLSAWDSGLVSFLLEVESVCRERGIQKDRAGLPAGIIRLIELAEAVPEKEGARSGAKIKPLLERVGDYVL